MKAMINLTVTAIGFVLIHILVSGTSIRGKLVSLAGEKTYLALYSLVSLILLTGMIMSYNRAPMMSTWGQITTMHWLAGILMFIAMFLVVTSVLVPNPTATGKESSLHQENVAIGILRITRHPGLNGIALWSLVHLIYNGDMASLVFFGALLATCLVGMPSIDAKLAKQFTGDWQRYADQTSRVPFVAIIQGRNTLRLSEFKWWHWMVVVTIYLVLITQHQRFFGVSAM